MNEKKYMAPPQSELRPPTRWYTSVNGTCGALWAFGLPALFLIYSTWSLWIKVMISALWILASGVVVDRFIPRVTNPVIEWVHDQLHGSRRPNT